MKTKKSFKAERSEKIAKVYLSGVKNINIHSSLIRSKYDFLISPKKDLSKTIIVEVKAVDENTKIKEKYKAMREKLIKEKSPAVVFYIDGKNEKGSFEIINDNSISGLYNLSGSSVSTQISKLLK